jgi:hypothetical protein
MEWGLCRGCIVKKSVMGYIIAVCIYSPQPEKAARVCFALDVSAGHGCMADH